MKFNLLSFSYCYTRKYFSKVYFMLIYVKVLKFPMGYIYVGAMQGPGTNTLLFLSFFCRETACIFTVNMFITLFRILKRIWGIVNILSYFLSKLYFFRVSVDIIMYHVWIGPKRVNAPKNRKSVEIRGVKKKIGIGSQFVDALLFNTFLFVKTILPKIYLITYLNKCLVLNDNSISLILLCFS